MTAAFTKPQPHKRDMRDTIGSPSRALSSPTEVAPTISEENNNPHCTPPSSPTKHPRPSTPKSTPLHRRFLKEVSMSPASPATPATPPRTPSRNQRDTPTKDKDSPTKVRATPVKHSGSPAKLEIGQNGFYFSIEIPMSKITPKKQVSPQKSSRAGTPTGRTPSPLKNETPVRRNPAKALFGTPAGKVVDTAGTPAVAQVVRNIEGGNLGWTPHQIHDKGAGNLTTAPLAPLRISSEYLPDVAEQDLDGASKHKHTNATSHQTQSRPNSAESAADSRPENIGHMMARLTSGSFNTYDWAKAHHGADPIKSPAPTPLRRASQKFYSVAPPTFAKMDAVERAVVVDPTKTPRGVSPVLTQEVEVLGGKYFDENKRVKSPAMKMNGGIVAPRMNPAGARVKGKKMSPFQGDATPQEKTKAQPSPYPDSLFPPPSVPDPKPETAKHTSTHHPDKRVQWQGPIFSPSKSRYQPLASHRRAGTDPEVYSAMQKDMLSMSESLRRSIGSVLSSSQQNTNELPDMSNAVLEREHEAEKAITTPTSKTRSQLTRWNFDTPAVCASRPGGLAGAKQRAVTLTGPGVPMWKQSGDQPAQILRDKIASTAKADGFSSPKTKAVVIATPRARANTASRKPTTPAATPRRQPRPAPTPARPAFATPAKKNTPTAAPASAKSKAVPPATPRAAHKPRIPHTPASRALPSSKPTVSPRKLIAKTPNPAPSRRLIKSPTPPPYDPADPRPYEEKFASAAVIAERVARWRCEERENATRLPTKTPSKAPGRVMSGSVKDVVAVMEGREEGGAAKKVPTRCTSPTKLPIRAASPSKFLTRAASPSKPIPAPTVEAQTPAKPITLRHLPKTPGVGPSRIPPPTPSRLTPRTPAKFTPHHAPGSRIAVIDRNAFRTPSKAIQSSLDRAIDERIREDRRAGRGGMGGGLGVGGLEMEGEDD